MTIDGKTLTELMANAKADINAMLSMKRIDSRLLGVAGDLAYGKNWSFELSAEWIGENASLTLLITDVKPLFDDEFDAFDASMKITSKQYKKANPMRLARLRIAYLAFNMLKAYLNEANIKRWKLDAAKPFGLVVETDDEDPYRCAFKWGNGIAYRW